MGEDREGHPVWYDHFSYDFRGNYISTLFKTHSRHMHKIYSQASLTHSVMVTGLFYSVRMDDIMTLFMYRAELCLQRCAKASVRVHYYFFFNNLIMLCQILST